MASFGGKSSGGGGISSSQSSEPPIILERSRRESVTVQGTPKDPPAVNLPTAQTGIPVPYVAGRQRIFSPNVIWYGNLQPKIETTRESSEETNTEVSEQGVITIKTEVTTETIVETNTIVGYTVDIQLGLCLGPDVHLLGVYENNVQIWSGDVGPARTTINITGQSMSTGNNPASLGTTELIFSGGAFDQAPDTYLDSMIATDLPGYVGIAHVIIKNVEVTGGLTNLSFEVARYPNPLELVDSLNKIGVDINPASAIVDIVTNEWGGAGVGLSSVDTVAAIEAATTLAAEENGCSLYIQQNVPATQPIGVLQDQTNGILYHNPSTGKLVYKLIRQADYTGITQPIFDEENVTELRDFDKTSWAGVVNQLRGTFTDRAGNYSQGAVVAQNLSSLSSVGKKKQPRTGDYPAVMNKELAVKVVSRDLSAMSIPVIKGKLQANRDGASLLPGDGIVLNWDEYGFSSEKMIVLKRKDLSVETNNSVLEVIQAKRPKENTLFTPGDDSLFVDVDPSAQPPSSVNFYDAPAYILQRGIYLFSTGTSFSRAFPVILPTAYNSAQTTFDVYIDNMPNTSSPIEVIHNALYPTRARLTAGISQYDGTTTGVIASLVIDGVDRDSWLYDIGETGVRAGRLFLWINDEIMSFESATDDGGGTWTLSNVRRALIDTVPQDHADNDVLHIIGNNFDYVSRSVHTSPSSYTPDWIITGNSYGHVGQVTDGLTSSSWIATIRANRPNRPHDTKIGSNDRSSTPVEIGILSEITVNWKTRSRISSVVALQTDAAEPGEVDSNGDKQVHRVFIKDNDDVVHDCGVTANDDDYNSLTFTVPIMASGVGTLWVRAETSIANSDRFDVLPVTMVLEGIETTEDGTNHIVTEDDAHEIELEG